MKKIRVSERLPFSPATLRERIIAPETWRGDGSVTDNVDVTTVQVATALSSLDLPPAVSGFIGSATHLQQTIVVPLNFPQRASRYWAEVPGLPFEITAELMAEGLGDNGAEQTLFTVDAEVRSPIPLVGPMIEESAAAAVERVFRDRLAQLR